MDARRAIIFWKIGKGEHMDYILDVLISKDDINQLNLSESLFAWGGELHSQDPPQYTNNSQLVFEEYKDKQYYERFMGRDLYIENCIALHLKGTHLIDLEFLINNRKEISNTELVLFLINLLKLKEFAILLLRDEEFVDEKYKINNSMELDNILHNCLNWSAPKGALITNVCHT